MRSERERAPGAGPVLSQNQPASQPTDTPKGTPALARLTWNGHAGLLPTYARRRGWHDPNLERLLRDHEAGALAIFDCIGPRRARHFAHRLLELCREVA